MKTKEALSLKMKLDRDDILKRDNFEIFANEQFSFAKGFPTLMKLENKAKNHSNSKWKLKHLGVWYSRVGTETWVEDK
jgi:hypothetical protein